MNIPFNIRQLGLSENLGWDGRAGYAGPAPVRRRKFGFMPHIKRILTIKSARGTSPVTARQPALR